MCFVFFPLQQVGSTSSRGTGNTGNDQSRSSGWFVSVAEARSHRSENGIGRAVHLVGDTGRCSGDDGLIG
jgi:hypothetical protein